VISSEEDRVCIQQFIQPVRHFKQDKHPAHFRTFHQTKFSIMERVTRYILIALCTILLLDRFLPAGCSNRADRAMLKRLDESRELTEQSISGLEDANMKLAEVHVGMQQYLAYVRDIQGRVEILDLERRIRESRFQSKSDSLKARLKQLYLEIDLTGSDLPQIPVVDLKDENL
jgi:hypothetical protein